MPSRLAVLLFCATLFGQSVPTATRETFHISGTVTQYGQVVHHAQWVTFDGQSPMYVKTDEAGLYEADLPLGVWKVAVTVSPGVVGISSNISRLRLIRVATPTGVSLDLFIRPAVGCAGIR